MKINVNTVTMSKYMKDNIENTYNLINKKIYTHLYAWFLKTMKSLFHKINFNIFHAIIILTYYVNCMY